MDSEQYFTEYLSDDQEGLCQEKASGFEVDVVDRCAGPLDFIEKCTLLGVEDMTSIWLRFATDVRAINLMSNQLDAWCRNNNHKRNKFSQLEIENLKIGEFGFFVLKLKFD